MLTGADLSQARSLEVEEIVMVAGVRRRADKISIKRSIGSDLPPEMTGGSGIIAATGTITWSEEEVTTQRRRTTMSRTDGWPPKDGDEVTVDVVLTDAETGQSLTARKFTGEIRTIRGGARSVHTSQVIDRATRLNRPVDLRPKLWAMPADDATGASPINSRLATITPVVLALADCGFHVSPPSIGIKTPGAGTFFPTGGLLATTAWAQNRDPGAPERTSWGMGFRVPSSGGSVNPVTIYGYSSSGFPSPRDTPWWFYADMPAQDSGLVQAIFAAGGEDKATISFFRTATQISVHLQKNRDEAWPPASATLSVPAGVDSRIVAKITYAPQLRVEVWSSHNPGVSAVANGGIPDTAVQIRAICAWQGIVGATALTYDNSVTSDTFARFTPSAKFDIAPYGLFSSLGTILCQRGYQGTAIDLIKEAATALCANVWVDEAGVFRWTDAEQLNYGSVKQTFTSTRIDDLDWEEEVRTKSRVSVKWQTAMIEGGPSAASPWTIIHQGSGKTMKRDDDPSVEFVNADAAEEWILPELNGTNAAIENRDMIARGRGTWVGGMVTNKDGDFPNYAGIWAGTDIEKLGDRALKITYDARNPNVDDVITWKIFSGIQNWGAPGTWVPSTMMPEQWRNANLPIVRAWGRATFAEQKTEQPPYGPVNAEPYEHDSKHWVQTVRHAQSLAQWLANRATKTTPVITGLKTATDARLQLGDKIRLDDSGPDGLTGLKVEGVIYDEAIEVEAGSIDITYSVRVTNIVTTATNAQVDAFHSARTNALVDAWYSPRTNASVDASPLT